MTSTSTQPDKPGESQRYWTHGVDSFPSPVAQFRMAQLIDMDDRLYETARVVYRFMVGWYHDGYGDALLSQRHVAKVMKQRAPDGAVVPSRNAVQRAILALMDAGWVVRSFQGRGRGKGASRYVPVANVLELAAQGKFPEPAHANGPVEPAHSNGPLVARANGPVEAELAHATGPKTLPPDSATEPKTGVVEIDFAPPAPALSGGAAAKGGFEELFDAYGVRQDKADARRAYEKLAPDADLHARMVEAARAWRQAAGGIERMRLRRWIEEERYDEDPKGSRKPTTAPAEPKAVAHNDNQSQGEDDDVPWFLIGSASQWPPGTHVGQFVDSAYVEEGSDHYVTMDFEILEGRRAGEILKHRFYVQAFIESAQKEGQEILASICNALGLASITDTNQLHYQPLVAIADGRTVTYKPIEQRVAA